MRDSGRVGAGEKFSAVLQAEGGQLVVPGAEAFVLAADFIRSGPDLILIGPDGQQILIVGFFLGQPTDLATEAGAVIDAQLAAKLAGPAAPAQFAQADGESALATAIGKVSNITGIVQVRRGDGSRAELKPGDDVYQDDVVSTAPGGAVGLTFLDGTTFALGSAGRMVLDEMVYDAAAQTGAASISVMTGAFTLVSGAIPKMMPDAMQLKTPAMIIGIRGTGVAGDGNTVALMAERGGVTGEITVTTPSGQTLTLNQPGMAAAIGPGGTLTSMTLSPVQISQMAGNALGALPNRENTLSDTYNQAANQGEQQQSPPPPPAPPFEPTGAAPPAGEAIQAAIMAVLALQQAGNLAVVNVINNAQNAKRIELDLLAEARRAAEAAAAARTKIHADEAVAQAAIAADAAENAAASLTDAAAAAGFAATAARAAQDAQDAYDDAVAEAAGWGSLAAAQVARAAAAVVAASADKGYAQGFAAAALNADAAATSWRDDSAIQARILSEATETTERVEAEQAKAAYDQALADAEIAEQATYEPMIFQAGTAAARESRELSFDSAYEAYYSAYVELNGSDADILAKADIVSDSADADPLVNAWLSGAVVAKLALADAAAADAIAVQAVTDALELYTFAKTTAGGKADLYNIAVGELTAAATALGVAEAAEIAAQAAAQAQAEAGMAAALAAVNDALAEAAAASQIAAAKAETATSATTSAAAEIARDDADAARADAVDAAALANTALTNAGSALTIALNNTLPSSAWFASAPASLQSAALQAYETAQALYRQVQAIQQETAKLAAQAESSAFLAQQSHELLAVADIAAIGGAQSTAATAATAATNALARAETAVENALAAKVEAEALLGQLTEKYPSATTLLQSATNAVTQITNAYAAAVAARDRASIQNDTALDAKATADAAGTLESARDAAQAGATAAKSASSEASAAAAQASQASNLLASARNTAAAYEVAAGRAADADAAQAALAAAALAKTNAAEAYAAALAAKNAAALAREEAGRDRDAAQTAVDGVGTADPHSLALATRALQQAEASLANAAKLLTIADAAVTAAAAKQTEMGSAYSTLEKAVASTVAASTNAQPTASHLATAIKAAEAVTTAAADVQRLAATANTAAADSVAQSLATDGYRIAAQAASDAAQISGNVRIKSEAAVAAATEAANAAKSAAAELASARQAAANAADHVDANPGDYNLATLAGYLQTAGTALGNANNAVTAATTALATANAARDSAQALVATLPAGEAGTLARALADRATSAASQAQASLNAAQRDLAATQAGYNTAKGAYDLADGTIQLATLLTTMEAQAVAANAAAQISVDKAIANRDAADAALATAQANLANIADLSGSPPNATVIWIDAQQAKAQIAVNSAQAAAAAAETARLAAVAAKDAIGALVEGDNWGAANAAKIAADAAAGYAATAARQAQIAQAHAESAARAAATTGELQAGYVDYVRDYNAQVAAQIVADAKPAAFADTKTVGEDGSVTIDVLANDVAAGGGALVYAATGDGARIITIGTPANGTATISGGGIVYTPKANFNGTETFTYTISNTVTVGGIVTTQTATATITVTVTAINDAPVVAISTSPLTYTEGGSVAVTPALTIIDVDSATLGGATVTIGGFAAGQDNLVFTNQNGITGSFDAGTGVLTLSGTASLTVYQAALRSVTYANSSANPDLAARTITITVTDGTDASAAVSRTLTLTGINDAPILGAIAIVNGGEDNSVALSAQSFIDAYSDPEGDDLVSIRIESLPANGILQLGGTAVTIGQVIAAAGMGDLTFAPNADWFGATSFAWRAFDGVSWSALATVPIEIAATNDAPVIDSFDATLSVGQDGIVSGHIAASDVDGDSLGYFLLDGVNRVAALTTVNGSVAIASTTGEYVFTPSEAMRALGVGETASDSFNIVAYDGMVQTDPQAVGVTITGANDDPIITSMAVTEALVETGDLTAAGQIMFMDSDSADLPSASAAGALVSATGAILTAAQVAAIENAFAVNASGAWTFALASPDYLPEGSLVTAVFTVVVSDGNGGTASQDVTITIAGTNDAPVIGQAVDLGPIYQGIALFISEADLLANASDVDGDVLSVENLSAVDGNGTAVGIFTSHSDGNGIPGYLFTPNADFLGLVTIAYGVTDGITSVASQSILVDITAPSVTVAGISNPGGALVFDGVDDMAAATVPMLANSGTLELWLQKSLWDVPTDQVIVSNNKLSTEADALFVSVDSALGLHFRYGGDAQADNAFIAWQDSDYWIPGSWHHVAVTWERDVDTNLTDLTLFADGAIVATTSTSLQIITGNLASWVLGSDGTGGWLHGSVDDVRMWDVARTAFEIQSSHQLKEPVIAGGLLANWTMDNVENGAIPAANSGGPALVLGSSISGETSDPRLIDVPARAMSFDGYDDLVNITGEVSDTSLTAITLESWIRTDQTVNRQAIISFDDSTQVFKTGAYLFVENGKLHFDMAGWSGPATSIDVADGMWHHVAAVLTAEGMLTLYVDGVAATAPLDCGPDFDIGTGPGIIGSTYPSGGDHFEGELADVRIWNIARTEADIAAGMNARLGDDEFGLLLAVPLDNLHLEGGVYVTKVEGDLDGVSAIVDNGPVVTATKPPSASDVIDVREDTPFTGQILIASVGTATVSLAESGHPQNGWLWLQPDGTFTYRPGDDFVGTDSFTIVVTGSDNYSVTKTFQVNVTEVDDTADLMAPPAHEHIALSLHGQAGVEIAAGLDTGSEAVTYEMWFNTGASVSEQILLSAATGLGDGVRLSVNNGQLNLSLAGVGVVSLSGPFNDGDWHHVAASISQADNMVRLSLTANGTELASASVAGGYDLTDTTAYLGQGFRGELSDVQVYLGLRDQATIQADMLGAPSLPDPTLVGWWLSADQSDIGTNTLTDASGSGRTGTITDGNYGWNDRVSAVTTAETALNLDGVQVYDPDAVANLPSVVKVVIEAGHGTLTLGSTLGLSFIAGSANGTAMLSFSGSVADINAALANLSYQPDAGFVGRDTVAFVVDEMDAGLTRISSGTMPVLVLGDVAPNVVGGEIAAVDNVYLFTEAMAASGESFVIRNALVADTTLDMSAITNFDRLIEGAQRIGDHLVFTFVNGASLSIEDHFTTGQVEWLADHWGDMRVAQGLGEEAGANGIDHLFFGPVTGTAGDVVGGAGDDYMIWQGGGGTYDGGGGLYNGVSFINATAGVSVNLGLTQSYNGQLWGQAVIDGVTLHLMNVNEVDGTRFADTLIGSADNADVNGHPNGSSWEFRGYGGGDSFYSGGGIAVVSYDWALGGITLAYVAGDLTATYAASALYAAGPDLLFDIFGVEGSDLGDILDVRGGDQFNYLDGGAGADALYSSDYGAQLVGGTGRDVLNGGIGVDIFTWRWEDTDQSGTTRETTDAIFGFGSGDVIDLSEFWEYGLSFGVNVWASAAGINDQDSLLSIDLTSDAIADFTIWVDGVSYWSWDETWFWLDGNTQSGEISVYSDDVTLTVSGTALLPLTIDMVSGMIGDAENMLHEFPTSMVNVDTTNLYSQVTILGNDLGNLITGYNFLDVQAGGGDDTVAIFNNDFISLDGGAGIDFLLFQGGDNTELDLRAANVTGVEVIDLSALGIQTLILDGAIAGTISDTTNAATELANSLVVIGSGDNVILDGGGWTLGVTDATVLSDPNNGGSYSVYSHADGAQVFVENGNSVTLVEQP